MLPQTRASFETRQGEVEELEQGVQQLATDEQEVQAEEESQQREELEQRQQIQSLQVTPQSTPASPHQKVKSLITHHTLTSVCALLFIYYTQNIPCDYGFFVECILCSEQSHCYDKKA